MDIQFYDIDLLYFELELETLRSKIDVLDYQLLDILKQRFAITNEIGEIKKSRNVAVLQIDRWKKVLESRSEYAGRIGLSRELVAALFSEIHKESIRTQGVCTCICIYSPRCVLSREEAGTCGFACHSRSCGCAARICAEVIAVNELFSSLCQSCSCIC